MSLAVLPLPAPPDYQEDHELSRLVDDARDVARALALSLELLTAALAPYVDGDDAAGEACGR